jgi:hypothetical protein
MVIMFTNLIQVELGATVVHFESRAHYYCCTDGRVIQNTKYGSSVELKSVLWRRRGGLRVVPNDDMISVTVAQASLHATRWEAFVSQTLALHLAQASW